jgi:hypothetical protein
VKTPEFKPLPASVDAALSKLDRRDQEILDLADPIMGGAFQPTDFVLLAVAQRAVSLLASFDLLVRADQPRIAATFVRMQLDSAVRFNAYWLLDDPNEMVEQLLKDQRFSWLKSKDKKPLQDWYLHEQLSEKCPDASAAYAKSCEFVHLSRQHMESFVLGKDDTMMAVMLCSVGPQLAEASLLELIGAFDDATTCLVQVCGDYLRATGRVIPPGDPTSTSR